jgi:hypothetical protein
VRSRLLCGRSAVCTARIASSKWSRRPALSRGSRSKTHIGVNAG